MRRRERFQNTKSDLSNDQMISYKFRIFVFKLLMYRRQDGTSLFNAHFSSTTHYIEISTENDIYTCIQIFRD